MSMLTVEAGWVVSRGTKHGAMLVYQHKTVSVLGLQSEAEYAREYPLTKWLVNREPKHALAHAEQDADIGTMSGCHKAA